MSELTQDPEAPESTLPEEGQGAGAGRETPQATELPVNLDEDPRFRKHKSKMDHKLAEKDQQIQSLQQRIDDLQSRADELALRDATPDEREQYLRNQLTQLREEQRIQALRQQKMAQANQAARDLLALHGFDESTPGINFEVDPTTLEGWQAFSLSVAQVANQRTEQTHEQVEAQVREAQQKALKETGAAKVSTATGGTSGDDALWGEYHKEIAALRGSGNLAKWAQVRAQYREKGLPL